MSELILKKVALGKSVFANRDFKKGEKIIEFKGKLFTYDELPTPYDEVEDKYVQIGRKLYMGPSGGLDDFFNHSCRPNAGLKISGKKATLIAIQNIRKGEEIAWDYSTTMNEDEWALDCKCGSKGCRKRIKDFKYLPKRTQQKYIMLGIVPKYAKPQSSSA